MRAVAAVAFRRKVSNLVARGVLRGVYKQSVSFTFPYLQSRVDEVMQVGVLRITARDAPTCRRAWKSDSEKLLRERASYDFITALRPRTMTKSALKRESTNHLA